MRILLTGFSCVGKSTMGKLLAENLGYRFFDFDKEVETRFEKPLARLKAEIGWFYPEREYRKKVAPLLAEILIQNPTNIVIAMPPSGLFTPYRHVLNKHPDVIKIAIYDDPHCILERLIFTDDDSIPIQSKVNDANRKLYFSDIKKNFTYYKESYRFANIQYHLKGRNVVNGAAGLLAEVISFSHSKTQD